LRGEVEPIYYTARYRPHINSSRKAVSVSDTPGISSFARRRHYKNPCISFSANSSNAVTV
jgi:hypothetical protein